MARRARTGHLPRTRARRESRRSNSGPSFGLRVSKPWNATSKAHRPAAAIPGPGAPGQMRKTAAGAYQPAWQVQSGPAGAGDCKERSMAKYVISYRAPEDYVPGREDDMAAWAAWFQSIGKNLVDFGSPVRDTIQIGDCGAGQRLRGYSVISADDLDAALLIAQGCPGLRDTGFGVEVGVVDELPG